MSVLAPFLLASLVSTAVQTWSPQGHRLAALLAANHRALPARQRVAWLLGDASLSDVSVRADGIPVSVFGSATSTYDDGTAYPCNLPHRSVGTER